MLPHMRDPYIDTHYSDFRERADASIEMSKEYKEKQKNKPENDLTSLRRSMSLPLHFLHSPDLKKKKSMLDGSTDAPPESDYDSTSDLLPQSERLSPTKVSHKRSADAFLKV